MFTYRGIVSYNAELYSKFILKFVAKATLRRLIYVNYLKAYFFRFLMYIYVIKYLRFYFYFADSDQKYVRGENKVLRTKI